MKKIAILLFCLFMPSAVFGAKMLENPKAIIACGASDGYGYYFAEGWQEDGTKGGKIILFEGEGEFDILFGNNLQSLTSYRDDGADVVLLHAGDDIVRVGAFHENYTDIYNFSLVQKTLAWSSNKSGPILPKAAVYVAECE